MKVILKSDKGFSLIELLIALALTGIITTAALNFYVSEHNNMLAQHSISDMQQNLRVCIEEITARARNAGSSLPDGIQAISSSNTNPDTLHLRYATIGGSVDVGELTPMDQTSPIHVALGTDLSQYSAGQSVYLWHTGQNQGEWFTITSIVSNVAAGWEEIFHAGQNLLFDPTPGDQVILLQEAKFYVDIADTSLPLFMRELNGGTPQIFAEGITGFDCTFILPNLDTVQTPSITDTVVVVNINMSAQTNEVDIELADREKDGRRRRNLSTQILIRNNRS